MGLTQKAGADRGERKINPTVVNSKQKGNKPTSQNDRTARLDGVGWEGL